MRAGFLNTNSLKAHIQEIQQFLKGEPSYHLFGKLGPVVEDYLVHIDGYTLVRQDNKVGGAGGGVALHWKKFKSQALSDFIAWYTQIS